MLAFTVATARTAEATTPTIPAPVNTTSGKRLKALRMPIFASETLDALPGARTPANGNGNPQGSLRPNGRHSEGGMRLLKLPFLYPSPLPSIRRAVQSSPTLQKPFLATCQNRVIATPTLKK